MWQATCRKLKESEAVNIHLNKQLAAKEGVLKSNNVKQEQLQAAIDGLTKTEESFEPDGAACIYM